MSYRVFRRRRLRSCVARLDELERPPNRPPYLDNAVMRRWSSAWPARCGFRRPVVDDRRSSFVAFTRAEELVMIA
jgi:hypothetical protein